MDGLPINLSTTIYWSWIKNYVLFLKYKVKGKTNFRAGTKDRIGKLGLGWCNKTLFFLHPSSCTVFWLIFIVFVQTLYLASALIKFLWNTAAAAQSHMAVVQFSHHQEHTVPVVPKYEDMDTGMSSFSSDWLCLKCFCLVFTQLPACVPAVQLKYESLCNVNATNKYRSFESMYKRCITSMKIFWFCYSHIKNHRNYP